MNVAVMQPYLFPYLGYWQLIRAVDAFVIFDDVNYINRGYINRNSILVNGQANKFTLELRGASQNKCINEIEVGDNQSRILKTVEHAYKKAPYYQEVISVIRNILLQEEKNLARFNGASLQHICQFLGLNRIFAYSSELKKDPLLKGQSKILAICKLLGATKYINPIGGTELYDRQAFQASGIDLNFIRMHEIVYRQFGENFTPYLSIIDVLMFNGKERTCRLLDKYELV